MTFMDDYRAGEASEDDIVDRIEAWLTNKEGYRLHEHLGLSLEQYRTWVLHGRLPAEETR